MRANAKLKNKSLAQGGQRQFENKTCFPAMGKDFLKRKHVCPAWARMKFRKNTLARLGRGPFENKTRLPAAGKDIWEPKGICPRRAKAI